MRLTRLAAAGFIVSAGALELLTARPLEASTAASFSCFLCVPPPIMCDGPYEWEAQCEDACLTDAKTCPFEDNRCPPNTWIVICEWS